MFQLIESSSGQLLNHMWGTSSTSAHFWEKCALALDVIIIEPCDISSTSAHFWEKCALVLDVMITEPCSGTSSTSAQFWEKCALVLYVMIIEPCLRYIKYKCTILGKMCTCTWCDDYWTMWHISSTSAHFWGKCALVLDWWLLNHVWVHQVQVHNLGKKSALVLHVMIIEPCLRYIKYKCTILGKMCACTLCDDYWTMFEVHQVQVHSFGENVHLYLMWWLLNHVTYIKYKCTFLGEMCTCTWCDDYWTMFGYIKYKRTILGKICTCTWCDDYWTKFEVHQVQVHIWDPKMFTTVWERGYKWSYIYNIIYIKM